jgi:hypothetical protein
LFVRAQTYFAVLHLRLLRSLLLKIVPIISHRYNGHIAIALTRPLAQSITHTYISQTRALARTSTLSLTLTSQIALAALAIAL